MPFHYPYTGKTRSLHPEVVNPHLAVGAVGAVLPYIDIPFLSRDVMWNAYKAIDLFCSDTPHTKEENTLSDVAYWTALLLFQTIGPKVSFYTNPKTRKREINGYLMSPEHFEGKTVEEIHNIFLGKGNTFDTHSFTRESPLYCMLGLASNTDAEKLREFFRLSIIDRQCRIARSLLEFEGIFSRRLVAEGAKSHWCLDSRFITHVVNQYHKKVEIVQSIDSSIKEWKKDTEEGECPYTNPSPLVDTDKEKEKDVTMKEEPADVSLYAINELWNEAKDAYKKNMYSIEQRMKLSHPVDAIREFRKCGYSLRFHGLATEAGLTKHQIEQALAGFLVREFFSESEGKCAAPTDLEDSFRELNPSFRKYCEYYRDYAKKAGFTEEKIEQSIAAALKEEHAKPPKDADVPEEEKIRQVMHMGFPRSFVIRILRLTDGSVKRTIDLLLLVDKGVKDNSGSEKSDEEGESVGSFRLHRMSSEEYESFKAMPEDFWKPEKEKRIPMKQATWKEIFETTPRARPFTIAMNHYRLCTTNKYEVRTSDPGIPYINVYIDVCTYSTVDVVNLVSEFLKDALVDENPPIRITLLFSNKASDSYSFWDSVINTPDLTGWMLPEWEEKYTEGMEDEKEFKLNARLHVILKTFPLISHMKKKKRDFGMAVRCHIAHENPPHLVISDPFKPRVKAILFVVSPMFEFIEKGNYYDGYLRELYHDVLWMKSSMFNPIDRPTPTFYGMQLFGKPTEALQWKSAHWDKYV